MPDLPLVNISPGSDGEVSAATSRQIIDACHDIGFMYVTGHGIPAGLTDRLRKAVIDYFSRAEARKREDCISRGNYRGYIPQGYFTANSGGDEADEYEGYKLHFETAADDDIRQRCDLYGPNKWPADCDELREAVDVYWSHCDRVTSTLLHALAPALQTDIATLLERFEQPLTNMTLLHYPPQRNGRVGIHPHKDTDALTILAPDPVGGLQVRVRGGSGWTDVVPPNAALVVNIGDMLEIWSGGYFVSTPHRVINESGNDRYSFPYFSVPRFDVIVRPLREPLAGFERAAMHVGDVSRDIWLSNWPDADPVDPRFDPATP